MIENESYFMFDISKIIFYTCAILYVAISIIVVMFEPLVEIDCEFSAPEVAMVFRNAQFGEVQDTLCLRR